MINKIKYNNLKTTLALAIVVVFYLIDRLIKRLFISSPQFMGKKLDFLPFSVQLFFNKGVMFGFSVAVWLVFGLSIILLVWVSFFCWQSLKKRQGLVFFAWSLILIGGFSNLLDRFNYGAVIDWWEMPWGAVINLADVYISAGVIVLLFFSRKRV